MHHMPGSHAVCKDYFGHVIQTKIVRNFLKVAKYKSMRGLDSWER